MTNISRRDLLKNLAVVGAPGAVAPLATPAKAQTTQKRDRVVAQWGDIAAFDPHMSTSVNDIRVSFNVFDNLVSRHPDQKLHPGLATEWKLEGQTTWRFKLRPGVKWHNGDPFSSADAKFSLDRTLDPAAKVRVSTVFTSIDRIETPDAATLVIHTKKPDPLLPARLAFYGGQIVPKKYLESVGVDTFNQKPIGTGPVRFVSWVKDDKAVFEANPDYWAGRSDFDRMIFRSVPEAAPRIASLLKGEVDVITQLPPDHGERVNAHPSTRVVGALYAGLYVLAANSKVRPLDNPLVKQALSLAVDRDLRRCRRDGVASGRAGRPAGLLAAPRVRRARQRRAVLHRREVPRRRVPEDDEDLPRAPAVDPRRPAVRGLRAPEARRVGTESEPAVRDSPLQLQVPWRLNDLAPVDRCLGGAACPAGKPRLYS